LGFGQTCSGSNHSVEKQNDGQSKVYDSDS
jgi:hypothetical protein